MSLAPVDLSEEAAIDHDTSDLGTGGNYFSQNAVTLLADKAGIDLPDDYTPAQKLKHVQQLMEKGDRCADKIFASIGCFLGHTVPLYASMYDIRYLLVLGRVMSGLGGDKIIQVCNRVLRDEYPEFADRVEVVLPNEEFRRLGQSMVAASLPMVKNK